MEKTTKTNLTFNFLDCVHYSTEKVETNQHSDEEIELSKGDIVGIVDIERNVSVANTHKSSQTRVHCPLPAKTSVTVILHIALSSTITMH